jgi:Spy/CpxP family protein refolding chaperone
MEMITINPERDVKMVSKKPPLPPKPLLQKTKTDLKAKGNQMQWKNDDENAQQIQKLIAMNDKLNTEIGELRKQLHHERVAVRELR